MHSKKTKKRLWQDENERKEWNSKLDRERTAKMEEKLGKYLVIPAFAIYTT